MQEFSPVTPVPLEHAFPAEVDGTSDEWPSKRAPRTQFLERLSWGLIRAATEQDVSDFVVELAVQDTPADSCWLMLTSGPSKDLKLASERSASGVVPELDSRFASWVADSGTSLRFDETGNDERCGEGFDLAAEVRSLLCLPLLAANRLCGVLSLSSPVPAAFTDEDQRELSRAAEHIAAALDRTRRAEKLSGANDSVLSRQVEDYRDRLAHAEKMSSLGGLLAGIVHELNNPLTTILGFAQLLGRAGGENKNLGTIISESERCARIVQSVLRIARPGAAEKKVIDLNASIREILELASYQLRLNQVTLGTNLTAENPRIEVNPGELTQVVLNLVTNAVQAIAGGETPAGRVGVATEVADQHVSITVEDTGPGIDPDRLSRIFDPFFTSKPAGTGLGLSLSRQMVEDNGGSLAVDSTPGEGATFTIRFPLTATERAAEAGSPERKRVLVVDDERHILELVRAVLCDSFTVECASSGEEGIERIEAHDFDLLISDLRMPGVGGMELVDWARSHGRDFRVLMLTGDIVNHEARDSIARSGASCLSKPFKIDELLSTVEDVLTTEEAGVGAE